MSGNNNERTISRRRALQVAAATSLAGVLDWTSPLRLHAADLKRRGMACILLWMPGGPSQFETFDPKPDHANGGETKAIDTKVSGVRFAEHLPELAKMADKLAVIRSMSTKEGDHGRGSYLMHTAYLPIAGVQFPTAGSVAAHEIADPTCELPAFVRIGASPGNAGAGYLGTNYDPFTVAGGGRSPDNARPATDETRFRGRLDLMGRLDAAGKHSRKGTSEHTQLYQAASRMILSPQMAAYELDREPQSMRDAYGIVAQAGARGAGPTRADFSPQAIETRRSQFGADCLLARRLIESGVTFVEARIPGWDTHQDNFNACRGLCGALDLPFAQLLRDLEQRGLLERTLVVWAGEFGRTPKINPNGGRDHFPRAFSAVLAGAGIRGGQVIGRTSAGGDVVEDRPVNEKDFFQSIYKVLGINAAKETATPIGRPIKFVDGGQPVTELFG